jgi:D-alanyl-lipoteichoic acid acyltransferase DltB (MBOAT superfamily)
MLFNSHAFIFGFLPITLLGFFVAARLSHHLAASWLAIASVLFYGYWNVKYVWLLLISISLNYAIGCGIARALNCNRTRAAALLALGITANLCTLGYYKYTNFLLSSASSLLGADWSFQAIILPLGISFFTFTQIAFLVDVYRKIAKEYNFIHYLLFVTYFPHLIAGPVLHHKQMMPQFSRSDVYNFSFDNMAIGSTIFIIGLFKKVVIADGLAGNVALVFDNPTAAAQSGFFQAWCVAISYSLQLYFDFSGYSDMAIGASRMFGIALPINFHSPFKSHNIIEFWRRWHMTLSAFLKNYVYIPLGGNRYGAFCRYLNLFLTMLLGGLWHGAGWTFVIWGMLHGVYLIVNHGWHAVRRRFGHDPLKAPLSGYWRIPSILVTFTAVTIAFVVFRATDLHSAMQLLSALTGKNDFVAHQCSSDCGPIAHWMLAVAANTSNSIFGIEAYLGAGAVLLLAWFTPNTQEIMNLYGPAVGTRSWLAWRPTFAVACTVWLIGFIAMVNLTKKSPFLYFQF